jgi:peptide/nickel transport system substrate-binding protein
LLVFGVGLAGVTIACGPAAQAPAPSAPPSAPTGEPAAPAPTGAPAARPTAAPAQAKTGGMLIAGNEADPGTLDPANMFGLPPRRIGRTIYNALVSVDEQGNVQPELVEAWEQPDDRTYLLKLRKGVKFHDGTDFNGEAVKFHFDRHLDPSVKSVRAGELAAVESTSIVDPYTVRVALKQSFAPFLAALFDWSGFVVSPTAVQKWGDQYGLHPVGTGPFKFVEYAKDQQTIVERNPDYWEAGLPRLDRITFRPIPVDSTRLTELRSGGVHIAEDLPLQDVPRLKGMSEMVLSIKDGFRFDYFHFVSDKEPYGSNQKLRQAVNWALDREAILQGAFFGIGAVGYQPFFPGTAYYDPNFRPYTHDLSKAKQLLEASGAPTPIRWEVAVTSDPVKQRVTQVVQSQLAELGIQLDLKQMDTAARTELIRSGNYVFDTGFGWWGYRPDPDQYLSTLMYSQSNNNYGHIKDPRIDDLLAKGRAVSSPEERRRIYQQLRDIVSDESIYIYYWEGPNIKGLSPKVRDFQHMPDSIIRYQRISLEG